MKLLIQLLKYGSTGLFVSVFGFSLIFILHQIIGLNLALSNALGYLLGLALSYLLNKHWTFSSNEGAAKVNLYLFTFIALTSFAANLAVVNLILLSGAEFVLSQACGMLTYSLLFFIGFKYATTQKRVKTSY